MSPYSVPRRTTACSRRPPASATLRLSGAAEASVRRQPQRLLVTEKIPDKPCDSILSGNIVVYQGFIQEKHSG